MSLSKVNFAGRSLEVFTEVDSKGEKWHQANPFAAALGYSKCNKALLQNVSAVNMRNYEDLRSYRSGSAYESSPLPPSIQAKTKFINTAGVFELINASEMPAAKKFRSWENNDLLPTLCHEGEYSMAKDAPADIAMGMNAVHAATNDGADAPWMKDMDYFKNVIVEKDNKIDKLTMALCTSNQKLQETTNQIVKFASALVEANQGLIAANKHMADIAQDVITKPSDPQLLHSLAVCALGGDQYAFLRPQKRSLKRSLDRLSIEEKDILFKRDYVPNSVNVLNKVKEHLPKDKYKAHHNRITLHDNLTKEDLLNAIESTLTSRQVAIIVNKASVKSNNNKSSM
ncbi:BRO-I [Alphabaculovirus altermyunipunctae]|uniref:BRO-I n=1 Tax=Mythimna unipuncta nucleopolyhedrovirus TaxID=447897 RepID=A0A346TPS4_9ABAC|nr:BRO-I [Mythimna unipuncta nucleopolyhedrovirus]AXU41584.1 BRO-I [Mythimna unipuncta nucleopolyhedrovirus]